MKWAILLVCACAMTGDAALGQPKEPRSGVTVDAWVELLAKNIADRHDTIRDSARAALVSVGKPALPTLKKIAAGKDDAAADAARKLIARIQNEPRGQIFKPLLARDPPKDFGIKGPIFKPPLARDGPKDDGNSGKKPEKGQRKVFGGLKGFSLPGPFGKGFNLARLDPVSSAVNGLKLSKDQQAKVDGIRKSYDEKTREQLKKNLEAQKTLREEMLKDVKGVLTPEQLKEFEEAVKKGPGRKATPAKGRKTGITIDLSGRFLPRLELLIRARWDASANR